MLTIKWNTLSPFKMSAGDIHSAWVVVPIEIPEGVTHLKFHGEGSWKTIAGLDSCGPDGMVGRSYAADQLLLEDCAVGALIGRFGGSTASLKASNAGTDAEAGTTKPFAVGRHAIVKLPEKFVGPVLLGFNIVRRPVQVESLTVELSSGV
jgi:hypothetical protein